MPDPKTRLLVESDAEAHAGGAELSRELCAAWGLKPYRRAKGFSFYSVEEIDAAVKKKKERNEP